MAPSLREGSKGARQKNARGAAEVAEQDVKHSKLMKKFQKSIETSTTHTANEEDVTAAASQAASDQQLQDLVPIPVPRPSRKELHAVPAYATLPHWLNEPIVAAESIPLSQLPLDQFFRTKLKLNGFTEALPVQAAVLPLLLPQRNQHPGDLCVSATTGSGKTLSYVLPILETIKPRPVTQLRAIIVVPTRELVSQVREVIQLLIGGVNIKVGTALGTSNFAAEARELVTSDLVYDPQAYQQQLQQRASAKDARERADGHWNDYDETTGDRTSDLPLHVRQHRSKIDILVCTPGRLVEHIRSTDGFRLGDLEWLVVDEADRLLDQSFQEWADVINSALDDDHQRRAPEPAQAMLRHIPGLMVRPRNRVRKVILSATITRDLDQLQSLRLNNPRLVVTDATSSHLDGQDALEANATDLSHKTHLPPRLKEYALPVGNGSEKPLFLLELLERILGNKSATATTTPNAQNLGNGVAHDVKSELNSTQDEMDCDLSSSSDESSSSEGESDSDQDDDEEASEQSEILQDEADGQVRSVKDALGLIASNVLVFAASNEAVTRLSALLVRLRPSFSKQLTTLSKSTSGAMARALASKVASGKVRIVIASDRASRGLDLPGLMNVVNYDIPSSVTSYVHRVGRTARAGNEGAAFTLLEDRQARWFWNEIGKPGGSVDRGDRKVERIRFAPDAVGSLRPGYEDALRRLKETAQSS